MHPHSTSRPRRLLVFAGAVTVCALACAGCGRVAAAAAATSGGPGASAATGRLASLACRIAKGNGDQAPAWITAVATTRAKALTSATPGDHAGGAARQKVFLITMRGRFTALDVSVPPGAKAPTGRYISVVVAAGTFKSLDFGIGDRPPPVPPASLGRLIRLTGCGR